MFKNLRKYKFDGGFLFLVLISVFGYLTYHVDKQTDGAKEKIDFQEIKSEIKEDYHELEAFFAAGESANHDHYNQ